MIRQALTFCAVPWCRTLPWSSIKPGTASPQGAAFISASDIAIRGTNTIKYEYAWCRIIIQRNIINVFAVRCCWVGNCISKSHGGVILSHAWTAHPGLSRKQFNIHLPNTKLRLSSRLSTPVGSYFMFVGHTFRLTENCTHCTKNLCQLSSVQMVS